MTPERIRIKVAEAMGWRQWKFGDPWLEGLRLADQKFNGYVRTVTRVYPDGVTLNVDESPLYKFDEIQRDFLPKNFWLSPTKEWRKSTPNYLSDLNAMHEAEKVLVTEKQCSYFAVRLAELVKGFNYDPFTGVSGYIWHATAAQRAEAFLRTIGKWEDSK